MLEAVTTDLVFTISLKRSTQNLQLSTSRRPITPSNWVTSVALCKRRLPSTSAMPPFATEVVWRCNMSRRASKRHQDRAPKWTPSLTTGFRGLSGNSLGMRHRTQSLVSVVRIPITVPYSMAPISGGMACSVQAVMLILTAPFAMAPRTAMAVKTAAI
jgi:hypothetical protein